MRTRNSQTAQEWYVVDAALFPRYARPLLTEALTDTRVVMLMGARQVGKSTLAEEIVAQDPLRERLTLDDKTTRDAATSDPTGFIAGLDGPVLIDEVQRAPDLLLAIKDAVDRDQRPGRFLLTGSANILTAPKVRDALTGRIETVELWPLAQAEIERSHTNIVDALFAAEPPQISGAPVGRAAFVERVASGGYPEARRRVGRRRVAWFDSYVSTTLERDLRDITDAHKLEHVPRLLRLLASQAANIYNANSVARSLGVDPKTIQAYTRLLETVFVVRRMPAWRPGLGRREVHAPKVYIADSGLLSNLMGADEERIANDDQITGKVFENFVAIEVAKHLSWAQTRTRQYHYRDDHDEVDIVLESRSGSLAVVEVKASATISARDTRPLSKLRDRRGTSFRAGFIVYTGDRTIPLSDRIWAVPVSGLWA
jgi:uncharacterized protein